MEAGLQTIVAEIHVVYGAYVQMDYLWQSEFEPKKLQRIRARDKIF